METKSVRVSGSFKPAYLNGRSIEFISSALATAGVVAVSPVPTSEPTPVANTFLADLRKQGHRAGEGVPFASLYLARGKKKLAVLQAA